MAMIPVMCIVQDGKVGPKAEAKLRAEIGAFAKRAFGEIVDIDWIAVPEGSGFTDARPSNAVIVSLHVAGPLAQDERTTLLKELGEICKVQTGCPAIEVVTSIRT